MVRNFLPLLGFGFNDRQRSCGGQSHDSLPTDEIFIIDVNTPDEEGEDL